MNLSAYNPFSSFDQLAIGLALMVVLAVFGWRILTGRPWRRTLPPDEIEVEASSRNHHSSSSGLSRLPLPNDKGQTP